MSDGTQLSTRTGPVRADDNAADALVPPDGRAANAWRHGMYARRVLVLHEDAAAFACLRDALVDEWRPRSATAWVLVDHLAKLQWRLMRAVEAEARRLESMQWQCVPRDPNGAAAEAAQAYDTCRHDSSLSRMQVFEMRLERAVHRVIGQLLTLRKSRGKRGKGRRQAAA